MTDHARRFAHFPFLLIVLVLAGCGVEFGRSAPPEEGGAKPTASLTRVSYAALPGWTADAHSQALAAFLRSCAAIAKKPEDADLGPDGRFGRVADWLPACRAAESLGETPRATTVRAYFESWFIPYRVGERGVEEGLITGYFEPQLNGSLRRSAQYSIPLYKLPGDLVSANLGDFNPSLQGQQIFGRVRGSRFVPYDNRKEITDGALAGKGLELLWVDDPIDAFFLQVQGSGQVRLTDGRVVRVGFAGRNGHPYTAIGRVLVARGALKPEEVSLQTIHAWLAAHRAEARDIMNANASYIFFRFLKGDGPIGAQGVALTPRRSLAVDRAYLPLGAPIWLSTTDPVDKTRPLNRLMIAQDTGSAIKGAVRGDVFWGAGAAARERAGRMNATGTFHILLPRAIAVAGS